MSKLINFRYAPWHFWLWQCNVIWKNWNIIKWSVIDRNKLFANVYVRMCSCLLFQINFFLFLHWKSMRQMLIWIFLFNLKFYWLKIEKELNWMRTSKKLMEWKIKIEISVIDPLVVDHPEIYRGKKIEACWKTEKRYWNANFRYSFFLFFASKLRPRKKKFV